MDTSGVTAGGNASFNVHLYDKFSNKAWNSDSSNIFVNFLNVTTQPEWDVVPTGDGDFMVNYTVPMSGTYMIQVLVNGVQISGSPWTGKHLAFYLS